MSFETNDHHQREEKEQQKINIKERKIELKNELSAMGLFIDVEKQEITEQNRENGRKSRKQRREIRKEIRAINKTLKMEKKKINLVEHGGYTQIDILAPFKCENDRVILTNLEGQEYKDKEQRIKLKVNRINSEDPCAFVMTLYLKTFQLHHLDWFMKYIDISSYETKMFPNTKEITESVSALKFALKLLGLEKEPPTKQEQGYSSPNFSVPSVKTLCLIVGDGSTPRTASLFERCCPNFVVHSIDPVMKDCYLDNKCDDVENITCHKMTIEDFITNQNNKNLGVLQNTLYNFEQVLIVAVHSHALFKNYVPQIMKEKCAKNIPCAILAIPCCFEQNLPKEEWDSLNMQKCMDEDDFGIYGKCRRVLGWKSVDVDCDDA
jgi:hypothetical protein